MFRNNHHCFSYQNTILFFFFFVGFSACISNKGQKDTANPLLTKCWTHSYEDDTPEGKVFLPCGTKIFPPSRFRAKFTLAKNGTCLYLKLAPNDAHSSADGTWTYDDKNKNLTIKDADGKIVNSFVLQKLTEDSMSVISNQ